MATETIPHPPSEHLVPSSDPDMISARKLISEIHNADESRSAVELGVLWRLAVKWFRDWEEAAIYRDDPDDNARRSHQETLRFLIALGLKVSNGDVSGTLEPEHIEDIEAMTEALRTTLDMWHHDETDERIQALEKQIFGEPA